MLVVGLGLAVGLVLLGSDLAARPVASPAIGQPGTVAAPRDVNVIMRDYHFDPTPLYLYPGETVRFNIVNGGMLEHELVLGDAAVQQAPPLRRRRSPRHRRRAPPRAPAACVSCCPQAHR